MAPLASGNSKVDASKQHPPSHVSKESEATDLQTLRPATVQRGLYAPVAPSQRNSRSSSSSESNAAALQPLGHGTVQRAFQAPGRLAPADVLALQRSMGNQAVQRMLADRGQSNQSTAPQSRRPLIQHKLQVGPVGDKYEQEADRVAGQVMRSLERPSVQRKEEQREANAFSKSIASPIQRSATLQAANGQAQRQVARDGSFETDAHLESGVKQLHGGMPLPEPIRRQFEPHYGADFSGVRLHTGPQAVQLNREMQSKAFTHGQNIAFNANQYNPNSTTGKSLLAHELTHVVQQNGSTVQAKRAEPSSAGQGAQGVQRANVEKAPAPTFLKAPNQGGANQPTIQRKFGFEIEVPILFTTRVNRNDVYSQGMPNPLTPPRQKLKGIPADAAMRKGETDVMKITGADAHVNVDHFGPLNGLVKKELDIYATGKGLNPAQTTGLQMYGQEKLFEHKASIMEVVTDAWDESTMTRDQAIAKFTRLKNFVDTCFNAISGDRQAHVGNYYLGSTAPHSDLYQPKLGYFHSTYGVKLHQVPRLFEHTTRNKDRLKAYAKTNDPQKEHSDNLQQTFKSIGKARNALTAIKKIWPRTGGGWFKNGALKSRGTKGWTDGTAETFLGFLTLIDNYLLMFKAGRGGNLGKQMVGMHYYKSDLYDVVQQLPAEIKDTLRDNKTVRNGVIDAIGASVGYAADADLGGPMQGWTLKSYLRQLFTGKEGIQKQQNGQDLRDPLLAGSINPYSKALKKTGGVVMENRHLEYLHEDYGARETESERWIAQESSETAPPKDGSEDNRSERDKVRYESFAARESGASRRPITEWVDMMTSIYDMLVGLDG